MNPKNVLTAIGVISVIEGLAFYFIGAVVLKGAWAELSGNALEVGTILHKALGSTFVGFGVVVLATRNFDAASSKKVLNAVGLANVIFLANALLILFSGVAKPPMPAIALMAIIAVVSFYTANKKDA